MKVREWIVWTLAVVTGLVLSLGMCSLASAAQEVFPEDFSTTLHRDQIYTNVHWDVSAGEIKLWPFDVARSGQCYLSGQSARGVAVAGEFAYVAADAGGLKIVNISNPASPTLRSTRDTPGNAYDVAVSRNYAFVADGTAGLQAIDVTDVAFPYIAGTCNTPGTAYGVAVSGDFAYVADDDSLQVVDISDPTNSGTFKCVGRTYIRDSGNAIDLCVSGDIVYVAADDGGLQIFDVSDPSDPVYYDTYVTANNAKDVVVAGELAYVAVAGAGVEIVDISGDEPVQRGLCDTPGIALGLEISGDWVYAAAFGGGVQVIDVRNPSSPTWVDSCATPDNAFGLAIEGGFAFVAASTAGLQVVRIAELTPPLLVTDFGSPGEGKDIVISGENAFVAAGNGGLRIVSVTYPDNLSEQGNFTEAHANGVAVDGFYVYVADADNGYLWVIDVSDVVSPDSVDCLAFSPAFPLDVAVSGDYAYVARGTSGLTVVDISDPTSISIVATYNTPGTATGVAISGNYAFVADGGSGLRILDISNPGNPSSAGSMDTPGYSYDVAVSGDYAYVADGAAGLQVIDTDSLFVGPRLVGNYNTPGVALKLSISGDYVFIADESSLQIVNVSNPANPYLAGSHGVPGLSKGICPAGDFEFLTYYGDGSGIRVIQVFQRRYNTVDNQAQSVVVLEPPDTILAVRVFTAQVDSIYWYVSGDGGQIWTHVPRDGQWHALNSPGTQLCWSSRHCYRRYGANPACTFLEIQLKYDYATIDSVKDVAQDQGGWLRVRFNSSGLDYAGPPPPGMPPGNYGVNQTGTATSYGVHRRIDDIGFSDELLDKGIPIEEGKSTFATLGGATGGATFELPATLGGADAYVYEGRYFYSSPPFATQSFPPGLWEVVGTVPAMQQPTYYCLVPSADDSMSVFRYTVYCITTHTTDPTVFYFSPADSGYSVDNLPPEPPLEPRGEYDYPPPILLLSWEKSPERDFSHYAVYKGDNPDFVPSVGNRIGTPWDSSLVDADFDPNEDNYYKISAWDIHENEGGFSLMGPGDITHVENPPRIPTVTELEQNRPNPFNPATVIRFSVARAGWVSLRIYDVSGRCLRTLVDGVKDANWYEVSWDGRDDNGRLMPSGVYGYKLAAPYRLEARKMVLAR